MPSALDSALNYIAVLHVLCAIIDGAMGHRHIQRRVALVRVLLILLFVLVLILEITEGRRQGRKSGGRVQ